MSVGGGVVVAESDGTVEVLAWSVLIPDGGGQISIDSSVSISVYSKVVKPASHDSAGWVIASGYNYKKRIIIDQIFLNNYQWCWL